MKTVAQSAKAPRGYALSAKTFLPRVQSRERGPAVAGPMSLWVPVITPS
jgi:hypothetical protein